MWTVTLKQLRNANACADGYEKVEAMVSSRGMDTDAPISVIDIAHNNGFFDALWSLRCLDDQHRRDILKFAVWCARRVEHLMDSEQCDEALNIAARYADLYATDAQLSAAVYAVRPVANRPSGSTVTDNARCCAYSLVDVGNGGVAVATYRVATFSTRVEVMVLAPGRELRTPICKQIESEYKDMFIWMCNGVAPWQMEG